MDELAGEPSRERISVLVEIITRIIHRAVRIEGEPVNIGYGDLLYSSEIHLIAMAGMYPGSNLSTIASQLGVTKGAVSQIVSRLEQKGYITRSREEGDSRNFSLVLTEKGNNALLWHQGLHECILHHLISGLNRDDPALLDAVCSVCLSFESMMEESMKIRSEYTRRFIESKKERSVSVFDIS